MPVILINAPMIKVRGEWALRVNYNDYQRAVLQLLARKETRLTGDEIRFTRTFFEMSVRNFAERFTVKQKAVLKWESKGSKSTEMAWSTEKDIRLFILDQLNNSSKEFRELYRLLKAEMDNSP